MLPLICEISLKRLSEMDLKIAWPTDTESNVRQCHIFILLVVFNIIVISPFWSLVTCYINEKDYWIWFSFTEEDTKQV